MCLIFLLVLIMCLKCLRKNQEAQAELNKRTNIKMKENKEFGGLDVKVSIDLPSNASRSSVFNTSNPVLSSERISCSQSPKALSPINKATSVATIRASMAVQSHEQKKLEKKLHNTLKMDEISNDYKSDQKNLKGNLNRYNRNTETENSNVEVDEMTFGNSNSSIENVNINIEIDEEIDERRKKSESDNENRTSTNVSVNSRGKVQGRGRGRGGRGGIGDMRQSFKRPTAIQNQEAKQPS